MRWMICLGLFSIIYAETPRRPEPGTFYCTVYYTPRETGFSEERGFDMRPETREGLEGRMYPRDFLRAVRKEGFGRMKEPVRGLHYMKYDGTWGFGKYPLGNRGNKLIPKVSCAVSLRQPKFPRKGPILIISDRVQEVFQNDLFEVGDTGFGIKPHQIDLYWGEDDPMGPGKQLARPKGTEMQFAYDVKVSSVPRALPLSAKPSGERSKQR